MSPAALATDVRRHATKWASALLAGSAAAILVSLSVAASAQTAPSGPESVLALEQLVNGELRCVSTGPACTGVDLYGDRDTRPVHPGSRLTTTVQLRNAGTVAASGLDLAAGSCRNEALEGATAGADLCATVTVALACASGGTTFSVGPVTLTRFGQDAARTVAAGLDPGASATCEVTVAYPDEAPHPMQAIRAVQPVTWTLLAPDDAVLAADTGPGAGAPGRGGLAVTGAAPLLLALAGLVLLAGGAGLCRLARSRP